MRKGDVSLEHNFCTCFGAVSSHMQCAKIILVLRRHNYEHDKTGDKGLSHAVEETLTRPMQNQSVKDNDHENHEG